VVNIVRLDRFELVSTESHELPGPDAKWLPAVVPGGVHESLLAGGEIGHPYVDDNELAVRWVEDRVWWYRARFGIASQPAADERLQLVLNGLDTVATVWLNDVEIGRYADQFRPAVIDITDLCAADNELLIRFIPPLEGLEPPASATDTAKVLAAKRADVIVTEPDETPAGSRSDTQRTYRRKATCSWGWDFAPRLPSIGLLEAAELRRERVVAIAGRYVHAIEVDVALRMAVISAEIEIEEFAGPADEVRLTITTPDGEVLTASQPNPGPRAEFQVAVGQAQLWWTHDLGDQPLYDVVIELIAGGAVVDSSGDRIGIRSIELDRQTDPFQHGRLFRFILNGVPVFARGANWVPMSMLPGSVTPDDARALVARARDGEMNMIRIWGGGFYESDAFYDACDDLGVLVWQDFAFACNDYPSDDADLTAEVEAEAIFQVRRLRNHASLAIWAGNNEVQAIHDIAHGNCDPGPWGWSFFHELLPAVVEAHSPDAIYWPGSPWGEDRSEMVNGVSDGDRHAWEVWHGLSVGAGGPESYQTPGEARHFRRYAHDEGRFISEFGIIAAPELGTLQRWNPAASLALDSPAFLHRIKDAPKDKALELMAVETGLPTTIEEYVEYSMAVQAEGMKFGVEHYRRRQPHCNGTLIWQLNDSWPGVSWSLIDHDLVPKASYYFVKRAYRPLLASFRDTPQGVELWLTNSGQREADLLLDVVLMTITGERQHHDRVAVRAEPYSSMVFWRSAEPSSADLVAWVSGDRVTSNRQFFAPLKDLPLGESSVAWSAERTGPTSAAVELVATGVCAYVRIASPAPGVSFDDNYVDLRPDERRTIQVSGLPEGFDLDALDVSSYGRKS
jgi:beta-mannosidase